MEHPTGPAPKRVILVGLGPTKSEYMNIMASDAAVINRDEVWGINGAGAVIKCDLTFAMDDYLTCIGRAPAFAKYYETASEPIFTSTPRNPTALAYPLGEVLNMKGARPYFNGSVSYVAAYAKLIGVEELTIFGCDYLYGGAGMMHPRQIDTVARYLACMAYWLGQCEAGGMKVVVCPQSPLLDSDYTGLEQFYGYVVKPVVDMAAERPESLAEKQEKSGLSAHLGGHMGRCHTDEGALRWLKEGLRLETMIDVGCGTGKQVELATELGFSNAMGIDGDGTIHRDISFSCHDYNNGPLRPDNYDLAWSVEFLEHVDEQYIANYMATFEGAKYVAATCAPPGAPGHHHVNCQPKEYWIEKFAFYGFVFEPDLTVGIRKHSTMERDFMRHTGMVFRNLKR
jgi:hypothetical protein